MALLHLATRGQARGLVAELHADQHSSADLQHHKSHEAQPDDAVDVEQKRVALNGDVESVGDEEDEDVDVGEEEHAPAQQRVQVGRVVLVAQVDEEHGHVEQHAPGQGLPDLMNIGGDWTCQ